MLPPLNNSASGEWRIHSYAEADDYAVLTTPCVEVPHDEIATDGFLSKLENLKRACTMNMAVGVAANRLGYNGRFFFLKSETDGTERFCINPTITGKFGISYGAEWCLSMWGFKPIIVKRFVKIDVEYVNEKGETVKERLSGMMAKAFRHEMDHLEGKTI